MKLIETYILADQGRVSATEGWRSAYSAISNAINSMVWPPGTSSFRIPRRVKQPDLRNGVVPLKEFFRELMRRSGWIPESPLSLDTYFSELRKGGLKNPIFRYPSLEPVTGPLHEGLGKFDFWFQSADGFRTAVEWETGNISSSHRSLNKMSMALKAELLDAAVLIVPSASLYPHLTDRIGNITELQPYFYTWSVGCESLARGLLAIVVVEQDELFDSRDLNDFIPRAQTGRSKRRS
jgi:hypothetical protein